MPLKSLNAIGRSRAPGLVVSLIPAMVAALLLAGCSDSGTTPGPTNPGGSGTQTLLVVGEVNGSDDGGGLYSTSFVVTVFDALQAPVTGATVTIMGPFGPISLPDEGGNPGSYTASRNDYTPGTYTMSVVSGTDNVTDVWVIAPDIHTITSPKDLDTVPADQDLDVMWSRLVASQEAWLETRDYNSPTGADAGMITVPAVDNPARSDQRIRVFRRNRQTATGGLAGSELRGRIRNSVEPVIVQ